MVCFGKWNVEVQFFTLQKAQLKILSQYTLMQFQKLAEPMRYITNYHLGSFRNVLLGAGLCFAVQNEKYTHLPIIILVPSIYAGYNLFENKDSVMASLKIFKKEVKTFF